MEKIYSIAGLKVKFSGDRTLEILSKQAGFNIFEINDISAADMDINIYMDENINIASLAEVRHIHSFNVLDVEHIFSIYEGGYLFEMDRQDGSNVVSIMYDLHTNHVFMSSCDCEISLKYAVWMAYALPALEKKVVPIHASSIVKDAEAVLFLGESGTGKSTHTRLWLQHIENSYLLNDDSPLLRIENDRVFVYGSPWSGKTHCYRQETVPLKAIVRLSQYPENEIKRLSQLISIASLQPSCPPPFSYDELLSGKVIRVIDTIIIGIPIYALKCRPDRQAAEIAYTTIY